jgi:tellurite resistance protein TerA
MSRDKSSMDSLTEATRSRAKFSGHGGIGAAGYVSDTDDNSYQFLGTTGQTDIFNPHENGYGKIRIGAAWQNLRVEKSQNFISKFIKKAAKVGIDLDLGCLYELHNGQRGSIQAFGEVFGSLKEPPYISLLGDDRTGDDDDDDDGEDEIIYVNGQKWPEIKRILIYLYIYDGAEHWAEVQPQVQVRVPDEKPMIVTLHTLKSELSLCAVAMMENVRNGIKMTNITEYYPGHAEMDRAFGFGLEWDDGEKSSV